MQNHEKTCVRNPNRRCYACDTQWPNTEAIEAMNRAVRESRETLDSDKMPDISSVEDITNGCPACILSAILQSTETVEGIDGSSIKPYVEFDYKKAMQDRREEEQEEYRMMVAGY